jgi:hypothetical protein
LLANIIRGCRHLKTVFCQNIRIVGTTSGGRSLAFSEAICNSTLKELRLENCSLDEKTLTAIATATKVSIAVVCGRLKTSSLTFLRLEFSGYAYTSHS